MTPCDPGEVQCCTVQQMFGTLTMVETPFLVDMLREEMDEVAASRGFSFHAAEWSMIWPESERTTITRMYVGRAAAD